MASTFVDTLRSLILLVACVGFLTGCSVGPDYSVPSIPMPASWSVGPDTRGASARSEWWRTFSDQNLNDLIERAVVGNLEVEQAKARIREARALRAQATGALFPQIAGSASAIRTRSATDPSLGLGNITSNAFAAGFDASWELDLFGARDRSVEAANYGVDAAHDDLDAVLVTLLGDVAATYAEIRGNQARIALARRTVEAQRATEELTRARFRAGNASSADTSRARALVANIEAQIPSLEIALAQSTHRLAVLLGSPPGVLRSELKGHARIPAVPPLPSAGVPADVLSNRPDVRRAERELARATALIGQAEAARYPAVSLTGNLSTTGIRLSDLSKNAAIGWSFGPTVTVPIFNGGELAAAVEAARARRDQTDGALRLSVLVAMQDVEDALVGLQQERVRMARLSRAVDANTEAARLSQALYRSGGTSFLDVLDAERSLYNAQDTLIQSRVNGVLQYIALNKALGGNWAGPIDLAGQPIVEPSYAPHPRRSIAQTQANVTSRSVESN